MNSIQSKTFVFISEFLITQGWRITDHDEKTFLLTVFKNDDIGGYFTYNDCIIREDDPEYNEQIKNRILINLHKIENTSPGQIMNS